MEVQCKSAQSNVVETEHSVSLSGAVCTLDSENATVIPLRKRTAQLTVLRFCYGQDRAIGSFLIVSGICSRFKEKCWF